MRWLSNLPVSQCEPNISNGRAHRTSVNTSEPSLTCTLDAFAEADPLHCPGVETDCKSLDIWLIVFSFFGFWRPYLLQSFTSNSLQAGSWSVLAIMRVSFSVTIPYMMKLELCPLITAIFLITGGFSARIARPYVQDSFEKTIELAGRAVQPLTARSIRVRGVRRQAAPGVCGGSSNGCWTGNYSIESDTDTTWPNTGRVVEVCVYHWTCLPPSTHFFSSTTLP